MYSCQYFVLGLLEFLKRIETFTAYKYGWLPGETSLLFVIKLWFCDCCVVIVVVILLMSLSSSSLMMMFLLLQKVKCVFFGLELYTIKWDWKFTYSLFSTIWSKWFAAWVIHFVAGRVSWLGGHMGSRVSLEISCQKLSPGHPANNQSNLVT
jgi:hypothetical protein